MARRDNTVAARALVEAMLVKDDKKVAARHGITARTLTNWRAALAKDDELSAIFQDRLRDALNSSWVAELDTTLSSTLRSLRTHVEGLYEMTPESVEAISTAFEAVSEIAIAREVLGLADTSQS